MYDIKRQCICIRVVNILKEVEQLTQQKNQLDAELINMLKMTALDKSSKQSHYNGNSHRLAVYRMRAVMQVMFIFAVRRLPCS